MLESGYTTEYIKTSWRSAGDISGQLALLCSFLFLSRLHWCLYDIILIEHWNFRISQQNTPFSPQNHLSAPYNVTNNVRFSASSRRTAPQLQSHSVDLHCHNANLYKHLRKADVSRNFSVPGYSRTSPCPLTEKFKTKEKSSLLIHPHFLALSKRFESQGKFHSLLNLLKGENRYFTQR